MRRFALLALIPALGLLLGGCASSGATVSSGQDPAVINAQLGLGYLRQGRHDVALEKLQRALAQNSRLPEAHHYIAVLYQRLDETDKADRHFRRALRYSGTDTSLFNNYGVFLCDQGRYDAAERQFLKVLADPLYPQPAQVNENLGICAQRAGDLPRAEKFLLAALKIDPRRPAALLGMAELSNEQGQYTRAHSYLTDYVKVSRHSPQSLWLGIQLARQLGNRDELASYSLLLRGQYPESREAALLQQFESRRAR